MNSLSQLNTFSATTLDVTDLRGSKVIFNRKSPLDAVDQVLTITTTTTQIDPGIEIEEIINYQTANVRYVVTIVPGPVTPLVGSTITWASLPAGVVLTQGGGVYTISNIHTLAQWAAIKSFNWNLPANATSYPLWYLSVQVIYYDSKLGTDVDKSWLAYDDRFYYLSDMRMTASLVCPVERVIGVTANLSATAGLVGVSGKLQIAGATLSSSVSLTATGGIVVANMGMTSTMSTTILVIKRLASTINSTSSLSVPTTKIVKNISRARTYIGNNENVLFSTNVPYIDSTDTSGTYTITFSSSIGTFSSSSTVAPVSPWTYTGTMAEVNAIYSQILFYPTKNYSSTGTITYTHALGGTTEFTRTVNLTGTAGSFATQIITFNTVGSNSWSPNNSQVKYGLADILIVGGGGGGYGENPLYSNEYGGHGGGGGGVRELYNQTLSLTSYTAIVGDKGLGKYERFGTPTSGGNSSFFGYTSNGGATPGSLSGPGGTSGSPGSYAGGTWYRKTISAGDVYYGGGGGGAAGAGGNGGDGFGGAGGAGFSSAILGYGVGAGGTGSYYTGSNGWNPLFYGSGGHGGKNTTIGGSTYKKGSDGVKGVVIIKIHS